MPCRSYRYILHVMVYHVYRLNFLFQSKSVSAPQPIYFASKHFKNMLNQAGPQNKTAKTCSTCSIQALKSSIDKHAGCQPKDRTFLGIETEIGYNSWSSLNPVRCSLQKSNQPKLPRTLINFYDELKSSLTVCTILQDKKSNGKLCVQKTFRQLSPTGIYRVLLPALGICFT